MARRRNDAFPGQELTRDGEGDDESRGASADREGDPVAVAREIALRQLTVRARSRVELARVLARKHVPEEAANTVLDRLTEVGLIDDAVFARDWLAAGGRRQKSRRVLLGELAEKGVDRELIDAAASQLESERDYEVASGFAARKAASLSGLEPAVRYRRLAAALARRGFPASVVAQVTREALSDLRESEDFDWRDRWSGRLRNPDAEP